MCCVGFLKLGYIETCFEKEIEPRACHMTGSNNEHVAEWCKFVLLVTCGSYNSKMGHSRPHTAPLKNVQWAKIQ